MSDLFEIYADVETIQLDLIFLIRNCLRVQPAIKYITTKILPKVLPGIKALANSFTTLTE